MQDEGVSAEELLTRGKKKREEESGGMTREQLESGVKNQLGIAPAQPAPVEEPWYNEIAKGVGGAAIGAGKGVARIADAPWRAGATALSYLYPENETLKQQAQVPEALRSQNVEQSIGGVGTDLLLGAVTSGGATLADNAALQMFKNLPWWLRYPGNAAVRGGTGAVLGAGTAFAGGHENLGQAALWGSAFNALPALAFGKGEWMRDRARLAMLRAMAPRTRQEQAASSEVVDMMLDNFQMWASEKGLQKIGQAHVQQYLKELDDFMTQFRARYPTGEPQVRIGDLQSRIAINAQRELTPGWNASGVPMAETDIQQKALNNITKWINQRLLPKAQGQPGSPIEDWTADFSNIEASKRALQEQVAEKGGFLSNSLADQVTASSDLAARIIATSERQVLNKLAQLPNLPPEQQYAAINEALHNWLTVRDIGAASNLREVGKNIPLSEHPFIGFGAHLSPNMTSDLYGLGIRMARGAERGPMWQSFYANLLNYLSNPMRGGQTKLGPAANFLLGTPERVAANAATLRTEPDWMSKEQQAQPAPPAPRTQAPAPKKTGHLYWENGQWVEK